MAVAVAVAGESGTIFGWICFGPKSKSKSKSKDGDLDRTRFDGCCIKLYIVINIGLRSFLQSICTAILTLERESPRLK